MLRGGGAVKNGYLAIETHVDHTGLVRLIVTSKPPDPAATAHAQRRIRYIARFNDSEAALMHTHEHLKRRLLDPDTHLYRVPLEQAIAAIESIDLRHRRIYLDSDFSDASHARVADRIARYRRQRRRRDTFFRVLGYIAIGMLLLNLFALSFA